MNTQSIRSMLKISTQSIQLTLPKIGIGWMFALLTSNFNRITIHELGVVAVLVTSMIGLYHFLSPFQVVFGRMTDRYPIWGLRRSPYLLGGLMLSALIFPLLPGLAIQMSTGAIWAFVTGFLLLIIFGIGFAMAGNAHLALIADNTTERSRGIVVAMVWTVQIASIIASAIFMKVIMPEYEPAAMQRLYNITVPIVLISTLIALIGQEKRLSQTQANGISRVSHSLTPSGNIITVPLKLLQSHPATRYFFGFIFLSTLGVFLQDSILEVFGAEVFDMTVRETTSFQQIWGGGVLMAMIVVGTITAVRPFSKKRIAQIGSFITAGGLALISMSAALHDQAWLNPGLLVMGVGAGIYTVGALSTMMQLSTSGATATYMGLWGMAQAFGNGFSSILAGGLHTLLIDSGIMSFASGYASIFTLEAALMLGGAAMLSRVSIEGFKRDMTPADLTDVMEMEFNAA